MKFYGALVLLAAAASTEAFAPSSMNAREVVTSLNAKKNMSRQDFFSVAILFALERLETLSLISSAGFNN